jgi:chemosensory pili system protein ChpC
MNATVAHDVRGVLIAVTGGNLLLPNASLAEVITYSDPEPVLGAPSWLLGRSRWRGWALPIVSYSRMVGWSQEAPVLGAKVAVLKAVSNTQKMPYFAVLTQGFPRLVTISKDSLIEHAVGENDLPLGVYASAMFHDDEVAVPDLAAVEVQVADALQQAAAAAAAAAANAA